jgi:prepilin-type N-terminal cleavage/methylation domain-containing protein
MSLRSSLTWLRRLRREDAGMTLTELMVSVALMAVVATIFTTMLLSIQSGVIRQQARSETNDEARLAIQRIDAEVRSGKALAVPTAASTCGGEDCGFGYSVRVWTFERDATGEYRCIQWVVGSEGTVDSQKLLRRTWIPGASSTLGGWQTVAEGVVNRETSTPPFSASGSVLNVNLMMNTKLGASDAPRTVPVSTSVAIRNSTTPDLCSDEPST